MKWVCNNNNSLELIKQCIVSDKIVLWSLQDYVKCYGACYWVYNVRECVVWVRG